MKQCKNLIESHINGRSKWLRGKIKSLEKIEYPTVLENYELCLGYSTLMWIPFSEHENEIYQYCKECEHKSDASEVFQAMHVGDID